MLAECTTQVCGGGCILAPRRQDEAQQTLARRMSG